jgi:hypothetical protein
MTPDQTDTPVVAVDFDGTLVEAVWPKRGVGPAILSGFDKLNQLIMDGWEPVIHTSRGWHDYHVIQAYMNAMGYPNIRIVCGKLLAMAYIDDRAINATADSWTPEGN